MTSAVKIRTLQSSDYDSVIGVIDEWWGGRRMVDMLPKLFFDHFADTSFAAERDGMLVGFLVGFVSQTRNNEAYIHFVGVHPEERMRGLGRQLYERFFEAVRMRGSRTVRAVTAPINLRSMAFHRRMGFEFEPGNAEVDGVPVAAHYDGPGRDRVRLVKHL